MNPSKKCQRIAIDIFHHQDKIALINLSQSIAFGSVLLIYLVSPVPREILCYNLDIQFHITQLLMLASLIVTWHI